MAIKGVGTDIASTLMTIAGDNPERLASEGTFAHLVGEAPSFGALLRRYRLARGLTQDLLAERAGLSRRGIADLERGARRLPQQNTFDRLVAALVLDCAEQLKLEDSRHPSNAWTQNSPFLSKSPIAQLPTPFTSFIGREREVREIQGLLGKARLVTLAGAGGVGKTRLAAETAQLQGAMFAHGVRFVGLAGIDSPALLASTIASACGVSLHGNEDRNQQIVSYLRDKHLLLLLDNFEHLLPGVGLLTDIITGAPNVTVLVTSRERLNLREEWVLSIEGLPYPDSYASDSLEQCPAVRLFTERAEQAQSAFSLAENIRPVVDICRRVQGMPLALELAATWVRAMSCAEVSLQLERSLDFLATPLRNVPDRHRSMRAVLDRSWSFLSDSEQRVLARTSVFRGGFDQVAGREVAGASLAMLAALADKSLLRPTLADRYEVHELVRQYLAEKLDDIGETSATSDLHLNFYAKLVEQAEAHLYGPDQEKWYDRLELDYANLVASLERTIVEHRAETGLRMASGLEFFWMHRGYLHAAYDWLHRCLRSGIEAPPAVRARALRAAGFFAAIYLDDTEEARGHLRDSLALARAENDRWNIAWTLADLGFLEAPNKDLGEASAFLEEALRLFRAMGDGWGISHTLRRLGWVVTQQGQYERAIALLEEALFLARSVRSQHAMAWSLFLLGNAVWFQTRNCERALALYRESLPLIRQTRDKTNLQYLLIMLGLIASAGGDYEQSQVRYEEVVRLGSLAKERGGIDHPAQAVSAVLVGLARMAVSTGDPARAARLFGAAHVLLASAHWLLGDVRGLELSHDIAVARAQLGDADFEIAFSEGKAMTTDQALAYALPGIVPQALSGDSWILVNRTVSGLMNLC